MSDAYTEVAVKSAVASLQELLHHQSDTLTETVVKLEKENKAAVEHYTRLNDAAQGLKADGVFLKDTKSEISKYVEQVSEVTKEVTRLEDLIKEMDEWSKELSIKVKRL